MQLEKRHYQRKSVNSRWGKPVEVEHIPDYTHERFIKQVVNASSWFENVTNSTEKFERGVQISISPNGLEKSEFELVDD